ncbi:phosphoglycerate kinase [Candidatus Woesearchaeota archaeon B3_Woes]|nr:MAG: phosphoglycerate kinase [Candidatus Woesearchaeota archaeon B3_Woes]
MLKTLKNIDLRDKRVLLRVDFNVPLDKKGNITDDFKIRCSLPTIKYIKQKAKQVVLMSHLDPWKNNPASKKDSRLKMDKTAKKLSRLIGEKVVKVDDCIDVKLPLDKIVLLENLRFHKGEKENDRQFAKKLSYHGDVYVNDAFGTCHRSHASVNAIVRYFKNRCAGLLVEKEVKMLNPILKPPFYVVFGGSKIKSKIKVIGKFGKKADKIFIGGKMALAFIDVHYIDLGERRIARKLMKKFSNKLVLPVDYVLEDKKIVDVNSIPKNKKIFDVGSRTILEWKNILKNAKTIVWNGPLGCFEKKPFDRSTNELIKYLARSKAKTIIGGGETADSVRKLNLQNKMTHVSTGGGASLEFLEGKKLIGLKVLGF